MGKIFIGAEYTCVLLGRSLWISGWILNIPLQLDKIVLVKYIVGVWLVNEDKYSYLLSKKMNLFL